MSHNLFNTKNPSLKTVKFSKFHLIGFATIFAFIGGYIIYSIFAASPGLANVFVSPNGSDTGSNCHRFSPAVANPDGGGTTLCHTFTKAASLAVRGDRVEVEAGTYPKQTLTSSPSGSSGAALFEAVGSVDVAGMYMEGPSNMEFKDIHFTAIWTVENTDPSPLKSTNITFRNDTGTRFDIVGNVSNISVIGGDYSGCNDCQPQIKKYDPSYPDSSHPTNILVDGVALHDHRTSNPSVHAECLQILDGANITVRNNSFWTCDGTGDIGVTPNSLIDGLVMENNIIGGGGSPGYGIQFGGLIRNLVFRNNSATQAIFFSDSEHVGPYTFTGNYMDSGICSGGAPAIALSIFSHNVFKGGTCGPTDISVSTLDFVDPANHNWHLKPGANAIDKGDPNSFPSTDFEGDARPLGAGPDAGADEFQSGPPDTTPPTVSLTAPSNGATVSANTTVSANASDNIGVAGVKFFDGAALIADDTSSPYSVSWNTALAANGSHTITAQARDGAGNITTSSSVTVTVSNAPDTTPPTVSIIAPSNGASVFSNVTLSANASDNVNVAGVQFKVDGNNIGAEVTSSPYSVIWDASTVSNGTHTLSATARDVNNNITTASITVSVSAPTTILGSVTLQSFNDYNPAGVAQAFSYTATASGQTNQLGVYIDSGNGSPTVVAGIYNDNGGNPGTLLASGSSNIPAPGWVSVNLNQSVTIANGQTYWIALLGPGGTLHYLDSYSSGTPAPTHSSFGISTLPSNWSVGTFYGAGPASAYAVLSGASSDTVPPTVSLTTPSAGATLSGATNSVTASASDNVGVAGVQFYLDYTGDPNSSKLGAEDTSSPYSTNLNTTTLANGSHSLTAIARDAAGNTTTASTISITVNNGSPPPPDTTAPSIPSGLSSPSKSNTSITLSWNASSDSGGSGLRGYRLYRNNIFLTETTSLNYTDSSLAASTTYSYKISSIDNATNESAQSGALAVATNANPPQASLPVYKNGDLNKDGSVNVFDLSILLTNYSSSSASADIDGNGVVNIIDLSILLSNYGK